jgi:predicted nucleic acid-binding protein
VSPPGAELDVTLFLDTSALVRRYVYAPGRELVMDAMADGHVWCASALCRSEALLALHRVAVTPGQHARMWTRLRDDWDAFFVVPVDERCLAHAVELGATFGLRTVDAVHLAAADRLPRPARYATFDRRQIPAALALGFEVISSETAL